MSQLPVLREQITEHAEIAFAEFTFASPTTPRRGDLLFQLEGLACCTPFSNGLAPWKLADIKDRLFTMPVAMHYAAKDICVVIHDGKQRPNASSNLGDP